MASTLKHLRSSTADKRPTGSGLSDGQIAINTASGTPGLFVKDNAGDVVKIGPAHVGTTAPNAVPAGSTGNSKGEMWVDENLTTRGLKYYDGTNFVNLTPSGTSTTVGLVQLATNAETQAGTVSTKAVTPSGLQSKVSDSISTTSSTVLASATAVKTAYDLANAALPKGGGTVSGVLEIGSTGTFQFDGSSADANKTVLAVVNPTANRTITLPNVTGTVVTTGDSGTVTSTMIADGTIVNADINASAAIVDTKLATISTAGKVSNSATTATNANTASAIVARDGSGNFSAGTISATFIGNLTGTASAIADDTVTSAKIVDGAIVNADINASAAIGLAKLATGALPSGITVASANIVDGTIVNADINASAAIGLSKLATGALPTAITVASANIVDGTIVNVDVNASAAIAGTKISPDFGSQTIKTTGIISAAGGSAAAPSITFTGDTNTGLYSPGADQVAISTNGTGRLTVGTTAVSSTLAVDHPLGAVGTPSITFTGDLNTGFWSPAADTLAASTGGSERARIDSSGRLLVGTSSAQSVASGSLTPQFQLNSSNSTQSGSTLGIFANSASSNCRLALFRNRATTAGGFDYTGGTVQTNDVLGQIDFSGVDGHATPVMRTGAIIQAVCEDTPTTAEMPSRLVFSTTADGASSPTERMRIDNAGTTTLTSAATTAPFIAKISTSEVARIDSSGRFLVGTSSGRTGSNFKDAGYTSQLQTEGAADNQSYGPAFIANSGTTNSTLRGCIVTLGRTRGTALASNTAVASGDLIGRLQFSGADGTNLVPAASITAFVDGTPGTDDMPGRLVFSVTADGSASPTEAMRINNARELLVGYTTDNGAYKLQVNSQIFATSATIATSDGRYKENVASLGGCLDLVKALRPVSFTWKPQEDITRLDDEGNKVLVREGHNFPEGTQVGFIAQEVQEVLDGKPWLSSVIKENVRPAVKDNEGNELAPEEQFYGIAEGNLIAVLTNALQEAVGRIEALEAEVAALKS